MLADAELSDWCGQVLGSRPARILFRSGHLAHVTGVSLADGSPVVIKVRPFQPRISGCVAVQAHLARGGFSCPVPLAGPAVVRGLAVTAETFIGGGRQLPAERGGLWVRLFNAKKDAVAGGGPQLDRLAAELADRLALAGLLRDA